MSIRTEDTKYDYFLVSFIFILVLVAGYFLAINAKKIDEVMEVSILAQLFFGIVGFANLAGLTFPAFAAAAFFNIFVLNRGDDNDHRGTSGIIGIILWLAGTFLLIWPLIGLVGIVFYLVKKEPT